MIIFLDEKLNGVLPINRIELIELVNSWGRLDYFLTTDNIKIDEVEPKECYDLSKLDVSKIENFTDIFCYSPYNGDLSKWNMNNAITLEFMFYSSEFNNDSISNWNTINVENLRYLFCYSKFNQNLNWNVLNVKYFERTFAQSLFDKNINLLNIDKHANIYALFDHNPNFKNKYNDGIELPLNSEDLFDWFEKNREKIRDINTSKEEVLDFFSFDDKIKEIV